MKKKRGRPLNPDKKKKLHVSVDKDVYDYLQTIPNKSEFVNKATWILLKAYKKADNGNATGISS